MSNLKNILSGLIFTDAKLIDKVNAISGPALVDPGKYTAFEVTTTNQNKTQLFTLLVDGSLIGASASSIGNYNIIVDWGDGTQSHYSNTTIVTKATDDNQAVWKNESMIYYKYKFAEQRMDVTYKHTYTDNGTYKIKILGTTYYQIRHTSASSNNLVSRCFEYDLPIFSGITRLQGIFQKCNLLTKINCPTNYQWPTNLKDASQLFDSCENLQEVGEIILPSTVLSLRRAFYSCSKLKTGIFVPDSIINTQGMYTNCIQLTYAPNTGKNNRCIQIMFGNCIKLNKIDGVISKQCRYANGAFNNTPKLINTPEFEQGIIWGAADGEDAWKDSGDTYKLSSTIANMFNKSGIINAPENLGSCELSCNIGADGMFYNCTNMTSFPALPNGIKNCINTFQNCYQAKKLHRNTSTGYLDTIPSSVITMDQTFQNCYSLIEIQPMPNNIQTAKYCYSNCLSLTDTGNIFPAGACLNLTNLDSIFSHCENLIMFSSRIPSSVTNMHGMFSYCQNLRKMYYTYDWLNFNTPITDFSYAFYYCSSLNKLQGTIPNTVINASYAFDGCYSATKLPTFHWDINSVCLSANNLYNGCQNLNCTIRIPKNLQSANSMCYNCKKLELNVKNLIFYSFTSSKTISISNMFNQCQSLYGSQKQIDSLGNKLWNSKKTFSVTSGVFTGCSHALRLYIPTTWGGLKQI